MEGSGEPLVFIPTQVFQADKLGLLNWCRAMRSRLYDPSSAQTLCE